MVLVIFIIRRSVGLSGQNPQTLKVLGDLIYWIRQVTFIARPGSLEVMAVVKDSTNTDSVKAFPPPTNKKLRIKDLWSLPLEVIWITLLILPQIVLAAFRKIFPTTKSLKGQVALVTGAGRGLGRGLALAFAKEGCKVAVADVNLASGEDTAEEIRKAGGQAKAYCCNVAKVDDVKRLRTAITEDLGAVDLLVNNAGLVFSKSLDNCTEEDVTGVINVNLLSHFWMVKEFLPSMRERNSGHIVAICSITAYVGGADGSAYVASKFGVKGFMESVRAELNKIPSNNIKTTTVCPYFINTSADYVNQWDLRWPAMSIDEAVQATIRGVKREEVMFTIPEYLHYTMEFNRLLPQKCFDRFYKVFYTNMVIPDKEETTPTTAIIKDLAATKLTSKDL